MHFRLWPPFAALLFRFVIGVDSNMFILCTYKYSTPLCVASIDELTAGELFGHPFQSLGCILACPSSSCKIVRLCAFFCSYGTTATSIVYSLNLASKRRILNTSEDT